ncbi:hypothetical protein WJX81_002802 [Elliptochloris bilobata]|uniref:Centromere protein J C-terminal domain-containing protein n=1 Tax=Elliptochloris bilobata TaxID=381761 RepID=A0AAW1RE65_9CHLO
MDRENDAAVANGCAAHIRLAPAKSAGAAYDYLENWQPASPVLEEGAGLAGALRGTGGGAADWDSAGGAGGYPQATPIGSGVAQGQAVTEAGWTEDAGLDEYGDDLSPGGVGAEGDGTGLPLDDAWDARDVEEAQELAEFQALEREERARLAGLRGQLEAALARLDADRVTFERRKEQEKRGLEEEGRRLKRERAALAKQSRELLQLPTRKERSQVEALEAALEEERRGARAHDARQRLAVERLRRQVVELQGRNAELREEVRWHEQQRLLTDFGGDPIGGGPARGDQAHPADAAGCVPGADTASVHTTSPRYAFSDAPAHAETQGAASEGTWGDHAAKSREAYEGVREAGRQDGREATWMQGFAEAVEAALRQSSVPQAQDPTLVELAGADPLRAGDRAGDAAFYSPMRESLRANTAAGRHCVSALDLNPYPDPILCPRAKARKEPINGQPPLAAAAATWDVVLDAGDLRDLVVPVANGQQRGGVPEIVARRPPARADPGRLIAAPGMLTHASVPVEEVRHEDGKTERVFGDGRREVAFANGTLRTQLPDGRAVVRFTNGDIKNTLPCGRVEYYYAEVKTWQTTHADGVEVFYFASGQTEAHHPGGLKEILFPDGAVRVVEPGGVEAVAERGDLSAAVLRPKPSADSL